MEGELGDLKSELKQKMLRSFKNLMTSNTFFVGNVHAEVRTCLLGLQEHINRAKTMLEESECLLADATLVMQTANECLLQNRDVDSSDGLHDQAIVSNKDETALSDHQNPEITDYATMMAIIYNMMKQDFLMQERIVSALDLKLSSGELESYCLMWSLRPFINDQLMREAWKLIR
ncbi:hypothetical protein CRG98_032007 [Punica granatum]|uniref:DUF7795 domain-containing protein n=1 Tax=Punica granatum TaxID=22663 RepID=A0A2I0IUE0_PUNGR|nr:hypothetical protein CRG98_032007 [Punica granatum]